MSDLTSLLDRFNFRIPGSRWQLFEFSDLWLVPSFVKHDLQDNNARRWSQKVPLLQSKSAAEIAADALNDAFNQLPDLDTTPWAAIDFCSGQGGPIPKIEKLVNHRRSISGLKAVPFRLSDLHPNLDVWIEQAARSEHLSFVPQPVDAANPSFSVISDTTAGDKKAAQKQGFRSDGKKVFRLFCTSFHHFDDAKATQVLSSTLDTSDAFAIIELQERSLLSLVVAVLETWLLLLMALVWFWNDGVHLAFTYGLPILPITQLLDEVVSCLRIRSFEETLRLLETIPKSKHDDRILGATTAGVLQFGEWQFKHRRMLYLWPIGYMNMIIGQKMPGNSRGSLVTRDRSDSRAHESSSPRSPRSPLSRDAYKHRRIVSQPW